MDSSIKIIDPSTTYIDAQVVIEDGVVIYPNNTILGSSVIESGATILPGNYIDSSTIKSGARVIYSVIENSTVSQGASVGPFSHLRPESVIGENARIGNFVEIKKSTIGKGTKVSHLSYVGDASVGDNVNIGCGVVFVNYNGKVKNKTEVKNNAFIGSSVNLIAPVTVGEKAFVCAGTTIDKNVDSGDFVIGRSKMVVKKDRAKAYLKGD